MAAVVASVAWFFLARDYESNFHEMRLAESAMILDRSTDEPYSGRLVARDAEISEVGCWVLADTPLVEACRGDTAGLILDAPVESGRLHGTASIRADLSSEKLGPAVEELFGDLSGLAQTAVPTVEIARAEFVEGHLEGRVELFEPSADPTAATLRAEATFVDNRLDGIARQYAPGTDQPIRELTFAAGVRTGPQRWFFADGALAEVVVYQDGKPHGQAEAYYADGSRRRNETWDTGVQVGVWKAWYPDGTLQRREAFDGSSPRLQQWYSDGSLALEADGDEVREFPAEGLVVEYYDTGQVRSKRRFEHGVAHGAFEVFYRDGTPWERGTFASGNLDGDHDKWWNNGHAASRAHYVDGRLEGDYERWYASGQVWEKATYRDGKRVGEYRKWWKNGTLAHEYIHIIHNSRYEKQPRWLSEGLAESLTRSPSHSMWNAVGPSGQRRPAPRTGRGFCLSVTRWDSEGSTNENPSLYSRAHIFTDYLRFGFVAGEARLACLMGRLSRGEPSQRAIEAVYGVPVDQMDAALQAWLAADPEPAP